MNQRYAAKVAVVTGGATCPGFVQTGYDCSPFIKTDWKAIRAVIMCACSTSRSVGASFWKKSRTTGR